RRGLCKSCPNVSLRSRVLHRIDVAVVKLFECGIAVPGLCREVINTLAGVVQSHHVEVETASKHFVVRIYEDVLSGTRVVNLKVRSIVQLEVERTVVDDIACIGSSLLPLGSSCKHFGVEIEFTADGQGSPFGHPAVGGCILRSR